MTLPIIDAFVIDEDGNVEGWACAINDLGLADVELQDCAAPRQECPRGFTRAFECKEELCRK